MLVSKTPWVILLAFWMMGATWWHVCQIKQLCAGDGQPATAAASADETPAIAPAGLTIADGDRFRLALTGNFSFARSGVNVSMNTLMGSLDSLTAYLKNGSGTARPGQSRPGQSRPGTSMPDRTMTITGYYDPAETNETSFANLGLARAEGIKQYFVQQGIPDASLTTKGEARSGAGKGLTFTPGGDSLYGGIGFAFGSPAPLAAGGASGPAAAPATEEGLAAAEKYTSVFEPINLYFSPARASYIKTPETTKFFDEAATYLAAHKDKKLRLTGHTDNVGPEAVNLRLSLDRANDVKVGLRKSGIDQRQVVVDAKGETAPKAPNDTREGRRANRRVTVVVE